MAAANDDVANNVAAADAPAAAVATGPAGAAGAARGDAANDVVLDHTPSPTKPNYSEPIELIQAHPRFLHPACPVPFPPPPRNLTTPMTLYSIIRSLATFSRYRYRTPSHLGLAAQPSVTRA